MTPFFTGNVDTRWLDDGRSMLLLSYSSFTDKYGVVWAAREGDIVDGASIPKFFWATIGSPFVGLYRIPSVYHDVACVNKRHSWQDTHRMFFEAMLCAGVPLIKAVSMYDAVLLGGPKWEMSS